MVQTLIVYGTITFLMTKLTLVNSKKLILGLNIFSWLCILFFAIVFGLRYDVGRDYLSYLHNYEFAVLHGDVIRPFEKGFDYLTLFFAKNNFHFSFYFGFIALLQFFLLNYSFKSDNKLRAFVILSFMISCSFLSWMNGLRQIIALAIFIYAVDFIIKRDLVKYIICIIIASMFHTSALILFPIYFILLNPIKLIPSVSTMAFMYLISILIAGKLNDQVFKLLPQIINDLGYSHYEEYVSNELSIGFGYFVSVFLNFFVILNFSSISKNVDNKFFYFYFLFFMGAIWQQLFLGSIPLGRPNYYFYGVNFIIYAYYLKFYYDKLSRINLSKFLIIIGLLVLTFIGYLINQDDNTFKYNFYWDFYQ